MQTLDKRYYSFRADANALGGYLEKPFEKNIPTLAPVSLPAVGGFAMARSEAFTFDEIVTCSSAYTRVSGRENALDGSVSILVTAVVEGLNLLEVVTARRIVAQLSIWVPGGEGPQRYSLLGSRFEGLKVAGHGYPRAAESPEESPEEESPEESPEESLEWPDIQSIGSAQAAEQPLQKNHPWVTSDLPSEEGGDNFCPQVDGFYGPGPHRVVIPGFGRITLGQLVITADSVRLVALRADLGCPVTGGVTISCVGGGGGHNE